MLKIELRKLLSKYIGVKVHGVFITLLFFSIFAHSSEPFETLKKPVSLPGFELESHDGKSFTLEDLKGGWSLIFIGFTHCPDVCPVTLMKLEAARAELGMRFRPDSIPSNIFLAVDPARDKPILAKYLDHFHPDNIGVTGKPEQLDILVKGLDGFYRLEKSRFNDGNYNVVHTAAITVINPKGELVAKMNPPFHVHPIAEFLTNLIRRSAKNET